MDELLNLATLDPNLVYLALVLGLWVALTAAYIPGTGLAEVTAFVLLAGTVAVLASLPTNWVAVVILILGLSSFLMAPFVNERFGQFAEVGLIGQAIGGYWLFAGSDLVVSPLMIALTVVLAALYNRFILLPTMRSQHASNEYDEADRVIGIRGRVVKDLDPVGTVYVNKELWRARSDETLLKDVAVIVTGQDGLELFVEKAKREDTPLYERPNGATAHN